jgi:tetratricopeptide (TPR) repeat protein
VGVTICATAAERVEQVSTQTEFSQQAAGPSSSVDIEAALARVDAARSRSDADPLALEDALTALGDAFFYAGQYATAEPAYAEALQLAEQHSGAGSDRLLAPLLGLGSALAGSGRHEEAVPSLQRAVAITRARYGLFDPRQQGALRTLAVSLTAVGRVPEAQDLMIYRARAAEKTYGAGSPEVVPSLCDLGDWFADVGMSLEARMAFNIALNIVGSRLSPNDPAIVEPLRGIARTRMRAQSYPESPLRPHESSAIRFNTMGIPMLGPRELNREGEDALQRALAILEADPRASTQTRIETMIQMGDWYQIKKAPHEALPYYQRAWQLIHAVPSPSFPAATALDFPVRVSYPTPVIVANFPSLPPEEIRLHHVQIEFTVAADGSVTDARVVNHDTRDRYAGDVLDAMRAARFRPKFVDGEAVATPGMVYREVFRTARPRS